MPLEIKIDHPDDTAPLATGSDPEGSVVEPHDSSHYTSSVSETSENRDDYVRVELPYPSELPDDIHPCDSASESQPRLHRRRTTGSSRAHSRSHRHPRPHDRAPAGYRTGDSALESPESVDSAEDFVAGAPFRPDPRQRQSFYGGGHVVHGPQYAQSSSSGASFVYPPVPGPPSTQMVHFGPPAPAPYGAHYPQMGGPPGAGFPPAQPYPSSHHPSAHSHVGSAYGMPSPSYGGQHVMPFGHVPPAPAYFPPQYPGPYPPSQPWDLYNRYHQPPQPPPPAPPPAASPAKPSPSPVQSAVVNQADQDDVVKRVEAMFLEERKQREERDAKREAEAKTASEIATAQAERAASDAKIASDAAAEAREEVKKELEAKAAALAIKAKKDKEAAAERAESDAKIAEKAAADARKEMQDAQAAAVPPPAEKKAPIRFKDAIGRKFNFPFHLCAKWSGMEELIRQAFLHVDTYGPHVHEGHYDLLGPNGEIILPQVWDTVVEPDWPITMHMWPMPEPEKPKTPPAEIIIDDAIMVPKVQKKGRGTKRSSFFALAPPSAPVPPPPPATRTAREDPPPPPPLPPGMIVVNPTAPINAVLAGGKEVDKVTKTTDTARNVSKRVVPNTGFGAWMMGGKSSKPPTKAFKQVKKA